MELNPKTGIDLYSTYDHVFLENVVSTQVQMRTPPEDREQENNNIEYKKLLSEVVSNDLQLDFGGVLTKYEDLVEKCVEYKPIQKIIPVEIQAKILTGQELTPEEIEILTNGSNTTTT